MSSALAAVLPPPSAAPLVVPLVEAGDARVAGAKAARLAELAAAGLPVPDGFVVTVAAGARFAEANGLDAAPPERVRSGALPDGVEAAVRSALLALGEGPVAVRSSSVAEDLAGESYAGMYESVLDVRGADAVLDAVREVWASAHGGRARAYAGAGAGAGCAGMAVLVQRMVAARAAGVAFTADPVTGARDVVLVSAVAGLGDRLVSGLASAEEWRVGPDGPVRVRDAGLLGEDDVAAVAALARGLARAAGGPQDVEWAFDGDALRVLQARPMTALPDEVAWRAPWGGWARNFRLGEWIGEAVTPAFETWLLADIERAMHDHVTELSGYPMPQPAHLVVNGWYYYGLNLVGPERFAGLKALARIPLVVWRLLTRFRANAAMSPPLAHLGFDAAVVEWRTELAPAWVALVAEADAAVPTATPRELQGWIDRLAARAGRNFASVIAVAGYSAKKEWPLAQFWARHLAREPGAWLRLVRGAGAQPQPHDVQTLDWFRPTLGELGLVAQAPDPAVLAQVAAAGEATLSAARAALPPRLARRLDRLVGDAVRAHAIREEQTRAMTLGWPALRVAIRRIGEHLVARGVLADAEQVHFLRREEIVAAIDGDATPRAALAAARRATWERQRRLAAPLRLGRAAAMFEQTFAQIERLLHGDEAPREGELRGEPGSPGRATGKVRVLTDAGALTRLQPGEILVAPVTTPAWTPAFRVAAAVVTDTGSICSHASIVAREYGLPAVVATGDATVRLRDGQLVTVDGSTGKVWIEG